MADEGEVSENTWPAEMEGRDQDLEGSDIEESVDLEGKYRVFGFILTKSQSFSVKPLFALEPLGSM